MSEKKLVNVGNDEDVTSRWQVMRFMRFWIAKGGIHG